MARTITFRGRRPASVTLSPGTVALAPAETQQLTAAVHDGDGAAVLARTVTWSSSNEAVATVDAAGLVTAVADGSATITAECEGVQGTASVTVETASAAAVSYATDFSTYADGASVSGTGSGGFQWGIPHDAVVVTSELPPPTGGKALRFPFNSAGDWGEQIFDHNPVQEYWVEYLIYYLDGTEGLGDAYTHRDGPSSDNNKFFAFWSGGYVGGEPRGNFSTWPTSPAGDSNIAAVWTRGDLGDAVPYWMSSPYPGFVIGAGDRGRWMRIRIHMKIADFGVANGAIELWKDDDKLIDLTGLANYDSTGAENYLDAGYLMGEANSGFAVDTFVYISDFSMTSTDPGWVTPLWGALGDSNTHSYAAVGRGTPPYDAYALNWMEQLALPDANTPYGGAPNHRGLDFGRWGSWSGSGTQYHYCYAISGYTMANALTLCTDYMVPAISAGNVTHVALQCTVNDLTGGGMFEGAYAGTDQTANVTTYVNRANSMVDAMITAGVAGVVVLLPPTPVGVPAWDASHASTAGRDRVTAMMESIWTQVQTHAASVNTAEGSTKVVTTRFDETYRSVWATLSGNYCTACGVQINVLPTGESPDGTALYMNIDAHLGTILNGLAANDFLAAASQLPGISYTVLSDAEILENAGVA